MDFVARHPGVTVLRRRLSVLFFWRFFYQHLRAFLALDAPVGGCIRTMAWTNTTIGVWHGRAGLDHGFVMYGPVSQPEPGGGNHRTAGRIGRMQCQ